MYEKVSTNVTRRAGSSAAAETRSFLALRMACDATHPQSASRRYADRAAALTLQIYLDASRGHRLHGRPGHLQPPCWQAADRRVFRDHDSPCAASISSGLGRRIVTYNAAGRRPQATTNIAALRPCVIVTVLRLITATVMCRFQKWNQLDRKYCRRPRIL